MSVVKKIVDGVVVEVEEQEDPVVKTIENGVVVEKRLSQVKKKPSSVSLASGAAKLQTGSKDVSSVATGLLPSEEKTEPQEQVNLYVIPQAQEAATGSILSNTANKIAPNKFTPESAEDFNLRFEEETGRKDFTLGSDLPQISKAAEQKRFLKNQETKKGVDAALNNINSLDGSINDFFELKKNAPKLFDQVRLQNNIEINPEDIQGDNQEDKLVSRVYNSYQDKAAEQKLELFRQRREQIGEQIQESLPIVSAFTGKQYKEPANLQEAQSILNDINEKKAVDKALIESGGGGIVDRTAKLALANKAAQEAEKSLPALTQAVSGFVFEEESKNNPNATPFEVGKKIYSILNPEGYAIYQDAGGDKMYRPGSFGSGYSDTPKKADAINRQMMELGINAFQTFGNKEAIEKAGQENSYLKWKFTRPVEEETKHMIAASLLAQGIKPHKATDEEKDAVAETLPQVNRDMWFERNKTDNNTSLPSTGLGYSTKDSYRNTVEDASKTLLGWMMPDRGRERSLDVLEQQGTSDIVGENPESKARLSALDKKEKAGTITEAEKGEKELLEKYTDVRTRWQKFKDLSGSGVGQFAGFGTISAFTGGLGNVRGVGGAVKSLISPMADREGMLIGGYLMSREGNARDAAAMFPGEKDGVKRFVAGEVFSFIDTYIERLFPEEKFLSAPLKKKVAELMPKLTADNLRKELGEGLVEKISKTVVKGLAEQQKVPLQESAEEIVAAKLKDVFSGIVDPDREAITFDELLNVGTQSYLSTQLLGVPKGVMAQRNPTVPVNAIWDAASNQATYDDVKMTILEMKQKGQLTEPQANERISLLNTARKNWEDNPVLSGNLGNLPLPKKQNYLARLMNEQVLQKKADDATDDVVKSQYNKEIAESKKARKAMYEGEVEVTERNEEIPQTEDLWKEKIAAASTEEEKEQIMAQHGDWLIEQQKLKETAVKPDGPRETSDDAVLLETIKANKTVSQIEKGADLQYFLDKAGEDPVAFEGRFGPELTKQMIDKIPTEKLVEHYKYLAKYDETQPAAESATQDTPIEPKVEAPTPALGSVEGTAKALEDKKADIESRRQEEIGQHDKKGIKSSLFNSNKPDAKDLKRYQREQKEINDKYDAELAELEKQKIQNDANKKNAEGDNSDNKSTANTNSRNNKRGVEEANENTESKDTQKIKPEVSTVVEERNATIDNITDLEGKVNKSFLKEALTKAPVLLSVNEKTVGESIGYLRKIANEVNDTELNDTVSYLEDAAKMVFAIKDLETSKRNEFLDNGENFYSGEKPPAEQLQRLEEWSKVLKANTEKGKAERLLRDQYQQVLAETKKRFVDEGKAPNRPKQLAESLLPNKQTQTEKEGGVVGSGVVEDAEYNNFINKGIVSNERLNDIANKVKNQEKLSDRETEIFADKTGEINKIIKDGVLVEKTVSDWKEKLGERGLEYDPENSFVDYAVSKGYTPKEYDKLSAEKKQEIVDGFKSQSLPTQEVKANKQTQGEAAQPTSKGVAETKIESDETNQATVEGNEPVASEESSNAETEPNQDSGAAIPPTEEETVVTEDGDGIGITHEQTEDIRERYNFGEFQRGEPATVKGWDEEAAARLKKEGMEPLLDKMRTGDHIPSPVEQRMMLQIVGYWDNVVSKNPSDANFRRFKEVVELSDRAGGRAVGQSLVARKGEKVADESLAAFMLQTAEEAGVDVLTKGQKIASEIQFRELQDARKQFEEWKEKKEGELNEREAKLKIEETRKKAAGKKRTAKDLSEERQKIIGDILLKFSKAGDGTGASFLGTEKLKELAADVLKLARNLVESGVKTLEEVVTQIHDALKEKIPDIEKSDINAIIAGVHTEKKPTRTELMIQWQDLKQEAKYLEELDALNRGDEPVSEKAQKKRNQRLKDLSEEIKNHPLTKQSNERKADQRKLEDLTDRLNDLEAGKEPVKDAKAKRELSDEIKELQKKIKNHDLQLLADAKQRMKNQTQKIREQLDKGDFSKEEKKEVVLDAEGKALQTKLAKVQRERQIYLLKERYDKRSKQHKAMDKIGKVFNIPRSIMASMDFSALLNQGLIPTISHPKMALSALKQMYESMKSEGEFNRWFQDIQDNPRWDLIKNKMKIRLTDPFSPFLEAREEAFGGGYAEQIPFLGTKLIKGSERAYVQYLNKLRWDMANRFIEKWQDDNGKTYQNSKRLYDFTGKFINDITGSGQLPFKLEQYNGIFNSLFFSPRLLVSRLRLLSPYYVAFAPKELRKEYFKEMGKSLGLVSTVVMAFYLKSLRQDDDDPNKISVELDPRSTDFFKIRQGDTRWNPLGGFQPLVRLGAQMQTGQSKSANSGIIQELDGEGAFGRGRGDVMESFVRGKLSPIAASTWNLVSGRNVVGEKTSLLGELERSIIPLTAQSIAEAWEQYGALSLLKVGLPSAIGIGVQTYKPREKEIKETVTYNEKDSKGKSIPAKAKLTKEQYKEYETEARKRIEKYVDKLKAQPEYDDLPIETQVQLKSYFEGVAVREVEKEIVAKYKSTFEKEETEESKKRKDKEDVIKKVKDQLKD